MGDEMLFFPILMEFPLHILELRTKRDSLTKSGSFTVGHLPSTPLYNPKEGNIHECDATSWMHVLFCTVQFRSKKIVLTGKCSQQALWTLSNLVMISEEALLLTFQFFEHHKQTAIYVLLEIKSTTHLHLLTCCNSLESVLYIYSRVRPDL